VINQKRYLGDGLYGWSDGFHFVLECERDGQTHRVYLENEVVESFFKLVADTLRVKIDVKAIEEEK
jgi:hypothetical protein